MLIPNCFTFDASHEVWPVPRERLSRHVGQGHGEPLSIGRHTALREFTDREIIAQSRRRASEAALIRASIDSCALSWAIRISRPLVLIVPTNMSDCDLGSYTSLISTMISTWLSRPLNDWMVGEQVIIAAYSSILRMDKLPTLTPRVPPVAPPSALRAARCSASRLRKNRSCRSRAAAGGCDYGEVVTQGSESAAVRDA